MAVSDQDLNRMAKNLKQAFDDIAGHYEYVKQNNGHYSGGNREYRETAAQMATVAAAMLAVSQAQKERAAQADSAVKEPLAKPLYRPKST